MAASGVENVALVAASVGAEEPVTGVVVDPDGDAELVVAAAWVGAAGGLTAPAGVVGAAARAEVGAATLTGVPRGPASESMMQAVESAEPRVTRQTASVRDHSNVAIPGTLPESGGYRVRIRMIAQRLYHSIAYRRQ